MAADLDVFVVGGVGIDTIVRVPSLPPDGRESFQVPPVESYVAHTGHGVAFGCQALGLRTALADVIGQDAEGSRIRPTRVVARPEACSHWSADAEQASLPGTPG